MHTILNLKRERKKGYVGGPSIEKLETKYGSNWQKKSKGKVWLKVGINEYSDYLAQ